MQNIGKILGEKSNYEKYVIEAEVFGDVIDMSIRSQVKIWNCNNLLPRKEISWL